ncbi:MAG: hypothetical protein WAK60_07605 [Sedimentisphaerales bacterium]
MIKDKFPQMIPPKPDISNQISDDKKYKPKPEKEFEQGTYTLEVYEDYGGFIGSTTVIIE